VDQNLHPVVFPKLHRYKVVYLRKEKFDVLNCLLEKEKFDIRIITLVLYDNMQVVTREAIYYGLSNCSLKESLINKTLPYAQRYIYKRHNDKYVQLKQSGFSILNNLKVIVVEKLFYRNVIKDCDSVSKERVECSCLLQVCLNS